MERFDMKLGERIHGLNLLCSAILNDSDLRLLMREFDGDQPNEMYKQAKKALKKYFGSAAVTSTQSSSTAVATVQFAVIKQDLFFSTLDEYETYVAWKQYRSENSNSSFNSYR